MTQPDQLRQRVAFALHQLIVASGRDLNNNEASWFAPYLQAIDRNAFGNFRSLLFEITLNPGMGEYLNMRGNSVVNRTNPTPNENYAREIMQLFSIGVDTLNQDGTPVLDAQGNRVPSYDQATITNLARVFTGWNLQRVGSATDGSQHFEFAYAANQHETSAKTFSFPIYSNGSQTIPARSAADGLNRLTESDPEPDIKKAAARAHRRLLKRALPRPR